MFLALIILSFLAGVIFTTWRVARKNTKPTIPHGTKPLPGPEGLPIIGSVHQLEASNPWMIFHKWGTKYGEIYQCNLAGSNHVWISNEDIAHELLSRRAAIYSDRPHIPALLDDNRTSGQYLPLMSRNELWQRQRRFAKSIMTATQASRFYGYPELEAKRMMMEMLGNPSQYNTILESYVARVTCRLAWGDAGASDELKQRARELLHGVSPTGALGNRLWFVMKLPDALSPAKAWERRRARTEKAFFETMQEQVRADYDQHKATPSWMKMYFELRKSWGFASDVEGAYAVGMHGIAGALTIAAPMQGFCLAMCHYPQYMPKLQEEIDRVCGDNPPEFKDMEKMPYLRACIRESLRWRPAVPTGIPHYLTQDDVYNGYHIPAGSTIHPLEWGMSRNPAKYPSPNSYNPDRWVDVSYPTYKEPSTKHPTICYYSQFGYGRRTCQGQEVTEADLFCGIGALAWGFNINKAINPDTGLEIPVPEMDYSVLLIAKPKWFQFSIASRSEKRRQRVQELFGMENEKGHYRPSRRYWDDKNPALGWGKV